MKNRTTNLCLTLLFSSFLVSQSGIAQNFDSQQTVTPNETQAKYDGFGFTNKVTSEFVFISAPGEDESDNTTNNYWESGSNPYPIVSSPGVGAGAVYCFKFGANNLWTETQKITPNLRVDSANFGFSIEASLNELFVGAPTESTDENNQNRAKHSGAIYVFEKNGDNWVQSQKIVAPDRESDNLFGTEIRLHNGVLAIGAAGAKKDAQGQTILGSGAIYFFKKDNGNNWVFQTKITDPFSSSNSMFGLGFDLDDNHLLTNIRGGQQFQLYSFDNNLNFNLVNGNFGPLEFGSDGHHNIDIDGDVMVTSESDAGNNCSLGVVCGKIHVFTKNGQGNWTKTQSLAAENGSTSWKIGHKSLVSGNIIAAGSISSGDVLLYKKENTSFQYFKTIKPAGSFMHCGGHIDMENGILVMGDYNYYSGSAQANYGKGRAYIIRSTDVASTIKSDELSKVSIFPNPSIGAFSINNFKGDVEVINVLGEIVLNRKSITNNGLINLKNANSGLYFIKFFNENGNEIGTKSIVIK